MKIRLTQLQQSIVNYNEGALLVVAGPGSGKTRVLTERIRRILDEDEGHFRLLALTFTNKAANEMRERLEDVETVLERAFIGTMHSFCLAVLSSRGKGVGVDGVPHIFEAFEDRKQVLLEAVKQDPQLAALLLGSGDIKEQNKLLFRWLEMISSAKRNLILPEMVPDENDAAIYEAYNQELRASRAYDFDDLLLLTYKLFTEQPRIADFFQRQFKYIFVDEAQDVNEAQYRLLRALCGNNFQNVMMVGDPKQAIFVWNGASPKYLDLFTKDFKAKVIELNENFRSSETVVAAAQKLFPEYRVSGQLPIKGAVELAVFSSEQDEATGIVTHIDSLIQNGHPDIEGDVTLERCALIARTKYAFNKIEKLIAGRGWKFNKQVASKDEFASELIADFHLCLRITANPNDRLHLNQLLTRWGKASLLDNLVDSETPLDILFPSLSEASQIEIVKAIRDTQGERFSLTKGLDSLAKLKDSLSDDDKASLLNDLEAWRGHWERYLRQHSGGSASLSGFLSSLALGTTQEPRGSGLTLLTIHSAKGLEFDVVFVMGLMEGTLPDYRAKGDSLLEEKRNFFVAVTRSRRLLFLSYSSEKEMPWGDTRLQQKSRFLTDVGF